MRPTRSFRAKLKKNNEIRCTQLCFFLEKTDGVKEPSVKGVGRSDECVAMCPCQRSRVSDADRMAGGKEGKSDGCRGIACDGG